MIAVTTFSPAGYELYGRKFLETFVEYWPCNLIVYHEQEPDFKHDKIEYRGLYDIPHVPTFYRYLESLPGTDGMIDGKYDYNRDARKFTKKMFAQIDVLSSTKGKVFWLDADIETFKPVSKMFLMSVFGGKTLAMLQRKGFHTEAGFVGFDIDGEKFSEFLTHYTNTLRRGIILTLKQWHDCGAIDWAVEQSQVPVNNLSPFYGKGGLHVFPKSVLGDYMLHHKGNRKQNGKPKDKPS